MTNVEASPAITLDQEIGRREELADRYTGIHFLEDMGLGSSEKPRARMFCSSLCITASVDLSGESATRSSTTPRSTPHRMTGRKSRTTTSSAIAST